MKPKIILVGGGGHCLSCIDVIEQEGRFEIEGIVDPNKIGEHLLGYQVLCGDNELHILREKYEYALITLGQIYTPVTRVKLYNELMKHCFKLPIIISPRAYVSKYALVGDGSIIMHDVLINAKAKIGNNCIINTKALIEHNANIGNHCHISTGSVINGNVTVGDGTFVGSNAVVKHSVEIGHNFFVRSGSLFSGSKNE